MAKIILIANIFVLLLIFIISFQSVSLAENNPLLEFGQINISNDGQNPQGGSVYLKVLGQNKIFTGSQIINQNGNYIWQGNVLFNDGTSPQAGEEHIVTIEKQIGGVGYYAVTSKIITLGDINNPAGVQFPGTRLTKMYAPLCINNVGKIVLTIADIETAHNDDNLWGYRVYRQVDGGPYVFLNDVSTSDAQLFIDDAVTTDHVYKYKYKILTKDKEYEGQYFSQESESYTPYSTGCTAIDFSSVPTPDITSISHTYGSIDGALYITLTGIDIDGSMIIVDGEIVTVAQGDSVQFFTPPHSAGTVNIRVQMIKYDEVPFNYLNNPTINVCSPKSGTTFGGTIVEINGNYLYQGKTPVVKIGNKMASIQGQPTDEKLTIVTPEHSVGKVAVQVDLGNNVEGTKEEIYEYINPPPVEGDPNISHVVPSQGPINTNVVIMGMYFSNPKVFFGDQVAEITNSSSDFIFVTAPTHNTGVVDVKVVNDNGTGKSAIKQNAYIYTVSEEEPFDQYPIIQNIYPQTGVSGDIMVISGTYLSEGLEPVVLFGVTTNNTNKLSLAPVLNYTDQSVVVTVPSNPTSQNAVNILLIRSEDGKSGLSPVQFNYLAPTESPEPIISSIDPVTGNAEDVVVILGTDLCKGLEPEVFFGSTANVAVDTAKAIVTHYSDQIVVIKVPNKPSIEKSVDIYLKRSDGSVAKSPDKFTYRDEIILLGTLDIQKVVVDGTAVRNNDYINKALNSVVIYIGFDNSTVPSSGNAVITVNGTSISVSFNEPVTDNNKLVSTANISGAELIQFSNALQEGKNDISIIAISNNGEKTSTDNYSLYIASLDDELKLLPLLDGNLLLNYPNPFNPNGNQTTDIAFMLNKDGTLDIYLYDIKGTLIFKRDIDAHAGYNTYTWNGMSDFGDICGTGTYFYRMVDIKRVLGTAKMTIINK